MLSLLRSTSRRLERADDERDCEELPGRERAEPVREPDGEERDSEAASAPTTIGASEGASRRRGPFVGPPAQEAGVVSANAAWSGTSKRATPASLVTRVPPLEFAPLPDAFQSTSLNVAFGGRPPRL
jgi:hypothetical protein